ncbi:hypothetical protein [Acanthopleuribacter pedis]|uniref:VWA domain-containing protein n=1 Tax=Acanthopleuribacter pedis TaxID=442870 RepID=A0A8J7QBD5_9BACT|nr:hypothetical protein [Acanthopleuribacter pedis]MBO1323017.1 hypothetical protein [Acanthopleuribacter pedis]
MNHSDQTAREDVALFLNACMAATHVADALVFLHRYVCTHYRALYARVLALPINDTNRLLIVAQLLRHGRGINARQRALEHTLITRTLQEVQVNRVYRCFYDLCRAGVNNRRTRAVMRAFLLARPDLAFHAVKYRSKLKRIITHNHIKVSAEIYDYLCRGAQGRPRWETPLFERVRLVHFERAAIYDLPLAIAETLAAQYGIPRRRFLEHMKDRLTAKEKIRLNNSMTREKVRHQDHLLKAPLMQAANAALAIPAAERLADRDRWESILSHAAKRLAARLQRRFGKVALVIDNSDSSFRLRDAANRSLAVGLSLAYVLPHVAEQVRLFWTRPVSEPMAAEPLGLTNLAIPVIDALQSDADTVLIVSDGDENVHRGGADLAVRVARCAAAPGRSIQVFHLNPTYDDAALQPKALGPHITTLGLRDPRYFDFGLECAFFQKGRRSIQDLIRYLDQVAARWSDFEQSA